MNGWWKIAPLPAQPGRRSGAISAAAGKIRFRHDGAAPGHVVLAGRGIARPVRVRCRQDDRLARVAVRVHAVDEHGRVVLGGRGNDRPPGAGAQMALDRLLGQEDARRFDDDINGDWISAGASSIWRSPRTPCSTRASIGRCFGSASRAWNSTRCSIREVVRRSCCREWFWVAGLSGKAISQHRRSKPQAIATCSDVTRWE